MSILLPDSAPRYSAPTDSEESRVISSHGKTSKFAKLSSLKMPRKSLISFHPIPTTVFALTTYAVVTILLLVVHFVPPRNIPHAETQQRMNIDVDNAWRDLEYITGYAGYHPYNSRANDKVRQYLLNRISEVLQKNNVGSSGNTDVLIVDDITTNVTFAWDSGSVTSTGLSTYFEGTNILAVIKGSESPTVREELGAVLVNSHYDSVSTGYGATDAGTAVVSLLQLLSYFTNPKLPERLRPKRDLLLLWNNGEEDYLNGARAFAVSQWATAPRIFYNLEGAGVGGRATLFRSTDTEVTGFYRHAKRPFGTSASADGFKKGLIRSQTDYKVFTEDLGMRGLDVAFWRPRSKYHTQDDDVRHSGKESLWHMLGGAIDTVQSMVIDTSSSYEVPYEKGGTTGVWFDIFGRAFVLFRLYTLFAITISLLTITPFMLGLTIYFLYRNNRLYMFSNSCVNGKPIKAWRGFFSFPIVFTLATAVVMGTAFLIVKVNPMVVYGHLYLVWTCFLSEWLVIVWFLTKLIHWLQPSALARGYMFAWQWLFWYALLIFAAVLEDRWGVTAGYIIPLYYAGAFLCFWISLLEQFILPPKDEVSAVATSTPYSPAHSYHTISSAGHLYSSSIEPISNPEESSSAVEEADERTGLLSRGSTTNRGDRRPWPTFRRVLNGSRTDHPQPGSDDEDNSESENAPQREGVYGHEQRWSRNLTGWTWIVQWFLAVPMQIILTGQIGLFLGEALHQTGADGSDLLFVYVSMAAFAILYLLPLMPFMDRIHHYVFTIFLFALSISFILTLVLFPFSTDARLKVYFQQSVDLASGTNKVHLVGHQRYLRDIVDSLPSAQGKEVLCEGEKIKKGLWRCSWVGLHPNPVQGSGDEVFATTKLKNKWLQYNVEKLDDKKSHKVGIELVGRNTKACKVWFDRPVRSLSVQGIHYGEEQNAFPLVESNPQSQYVATKETERLYKEHSKFTSPPSTLGRRSVTSSFVPPFPPYQNPVPPQGTSELRLWRREWERGWRVHVSWEDERIIPDPEEKESHQQPNQDYTEKGKIVCLWSDVNYPGVIPAYDELLKFMPPWSAASKLADGLVEGWITWEI